MKKLMFLIFVGSLVWVLFTFLKKDNFIGFYYPNIDDKSDYVKSEGKFFSLNDCRKWVNEQRLMDSESAGEYEYECAKNCDTSKQPYVCEDTLK